MGEQWGEERLVKRVYWITVESNMGREGPQKRWRDEVRELLMGRGLREMTEIILSIDSEAWGG